MSNDRITIQVYGTSIVFGIGVMNRIRLSTTYQIKARNDLASRHIHICDTTFIMGYKRTIRKKVYDQVCTLIKSSMQWHSDGLLNRLIGTRQHTSYKEKRTFETLMDLWPNGKL